MYTGGKETLAEHSAIGTPSTSVFAADDLVTSSAISATVRSNSSAHVLLHFQAHQCLVVLVHDKTVIAYQRCCPVVLQQPHMVPSCATPFGELGIYAEEL